MWLHPQVKRRAYLAAVFINLSAYADKPKAVACAFSSVNQSVFLHGFSPAYDVEAMPSVEEKRNSFKTIQTFKSDYAPVEFSQYESERTGLRVVVVDQKGPKVHGYFALATEIHDDSGARKPSRHA